MNTEAEVVEYRVLGPVQVLEEGAPIDVGGPKPRTLLAHLLAHANEVVSVDVLIDSVWGGEPPASGANTLQVYISRLRRVLGTGSIESLPSGYRLRVDPDHLDALHFEELVTEGHSLLSTDAAQASALLTAAGDLWHGRPFADVPDDGDLKPETSRLEDLRLMAVEDRIDADLALGRHAVIAGELEALVTQYPLRERLWGQLMTALAHSGRQGEALRAYQRARRILGEELGVEPSAELQALEEQILLQEPDLATVALPTAVRNPYKGLHAFTEADAADFFGRGALVGQLLAGLAAEARLLAVVGPSGSGKSSVVRAGLIPALRDGAVPGSADWLVAQMIPGSQPFAELEGALLRAAPDPPPSLMEQLQDTELGVMRAALRVLPGEESQLLLLIDQFEEVFSLVTSEETRRRFLNSLVVALGVPHSRLRVIVTMRADFFDRPLLYPEFGRLFTSNQVNVMPLATDELQEAILEPAQLVGIDVEPALLTEIIADVGAQPGALPLLQYTLTELFERRTGPLLAVDGYRSLGGLRGALAGRAEELFGRLDTIEQSAAQQLLLRLVTIGERREDGRRRVPRAELADLAVDDVTMGRVLEVLGGHRLLTFDRDQRTGVPTVEVAHEALLRECPACGTGSTSVVPTSGGGRRWPRRWKSGKPPTGIPTTC